MASRPIATGRFCVRDGLLYKTNYSAKGARFLLVIPQSLQLDILEAMHDDVTAGHLGFTRSLTRTQERFYWSRMRGTVEHYVAACERECYKHPSTLPPGLLQPLPPPRLPLEQVGIHILGPFMRSSNNNRWVIICVDYLTVTQKRRPYHPRQLRLWPCFCLDSFIITETT